MTPSQSNTKVSMSLKKLDEEVIFIGTSPKNLLPIEEIVEDLP
jgi:hypothetical protein